MAPEQTGRMNRSIDFRAAILRARGDLLPDADGRAAVYRIRPLEWIHCHIARTPVPPHERVARYPGARFPTSSRSCSPRPRRIDIRPPPALSAICGAARRIGKPPSEIGGFLPGETDLPDRLLDPREALRASARHRRSLLACIRPCDRRQQAGAGAACPAIPELANPPSSMNFTRRWFRPALFFASGKFDQYKRDIPYATRAQARA